MKEFNFYCQGATKQAYHVKRKRNEINFLGGEGGLGFNSNGTKTALENLRNL
jgi:hypothetical protein